MYYVQYDLRTDRGVSLPSVTQELSKIFRRQYYLDHARRFGLSCLSPVGSSGRFLYR
jgi:hypothetical protein